MSIFISDKVVLALGGTGSLGSEIVRRCLDGGARKVIAFSRDEMKHFMLRKRIADPRLETVIGDIRDLKSIERIFNNNKVDIIYHAAAMKHVAMCEVEPLQAVETNILGTQNSSMWRGNTMFPMSSRSVRIRPPSR